jgi:uncharacterized protein
MALDPALLAVLVCPLTKAPLLYVPAAGSEAESLISVAGRRRYPIDSGVPVLLIASASDLSEVEVDRLRRRAELAAAAEPSAASSGQL